MRNVAETEVEMVRIPGETPDEIAANYARMSNEALASSDTRFSVYNNDMLPFAARATYLREINGTYFMEVEKVFYHLPVGEREPAE